MVTKISIFGNIKLAKTNPWANMRGKFGEIVRAGLAKPKKPEYILAQPPPWFFNKEALSPNQRAVNEAFRNVAMRTRGMPLKDRIAEIKRELAGKKFAVAPRAVGATAPGRRGVTE
jgi:hypothetical protein